MKAEKKEASVVLTECRYCHRMNVCGGFLCCAECFEKTRRKLAKAIEREEAAVEEYP